MKVSVPRRLLKWSSRNGLDSDDTVRSFVLRRSFGRFSAEENPVCTRCTLILMCFSPLDCPPTLLEWGLLLLRPLILVGPG